MGRGAGERRPINVDAVTISLYVDIVTARNGRAGAELDFEGVETPFPSDQQEHYAGLVVGRIANT